MSKEELWIKFKKTGNMDIKNKLIEEYTYLLKIVAGRLYNYYGGNVEYDDLLGFGVLGLIDAIEKFDLSKNIKFETYAQIRIRGSVIDNLRKLDWIPRSLRKKAKKLENIISKLENKLGRKVTVKDIAKELKKDEKEVDKMLNEVSTFNIVSLDEIINARGDINLDKYNKNNPEISFQNQEIKAILKDIIESLPNKQKMVISLYYFDELTYKEIGRILEVSESRISQIHSKTILEIKALLKKQGIDNY